MSYRDPRDPRTARYEPGYDDQYRGVGGNYSDRTQGYDDQAQGYHQAYTQGPHDPGYGAAGYDQRYNDQGYGNQGAPARPRKKVGPDINVGMFVGGVVMTGVVTGLAAWLVAWIIRAIVDRINAAGNLGVWNPVAQDPYWFAVVGFFAAVVAGAFWFVLQIITPSPNQFFRWVVGLLIVAAVIIPLVLSAQFSVGLGTAVMHLVIGLPVFSLIPAMGHKSLNRNR